MKHRQSQRENGKIRVLAIERMLTKDRYISSGEIRQRLKDRHGITCDRKTIYDDMYAINRIIPLEVKTGANGGYRIMEFDWE